MVTIAQQKQMKKAFPSNALKKSSRIIPKFKGRYPTVNARRIFCFVFALIWKCATLCCDIS